MTVKCAINGCHSNLCGTLFNNSGEKLMRGLQEDSPSVITVKSAISILYGVVFYGLGKSLLKRRNKVRCPCYITI